MEFLKIKKKIEKKVYRKWDSNPGREPRNKQKSLHPESFNLVPGDLRHLATTLGNFPKSYINDSLGVFT